MTPITDSQGHTEILYRNTCECNQTFWFPSTCNSCTSLDTLIDMIFRQNRPSRNLDSKIIVLMNFKPERISHTPNIRYSSSDRGISHATLGTLGLNENLRSDGAGGVSLCSLRSCATRSDFVVNSSQHSSQVWVDLDRRDDFFVFFSRETGSSSFSTIDSPPAQ